MPIYCGIGRYRDAEPLLKRELTIIEKTHGRDHWEVIKTLVDLAALYDVEGRTAAGEKLYRRALAIKNDKHPSVAGWLNLLAEDYRDHGRNAEAELLAKRVRAISDNKFSPYRL